jgi:hypothetical protein
VLHIALTAVGPDDDEAGRDVLVRMRAGRLVRELAMELASWLGLPVGADAYGLVVQRTGEHLVPGRQLDQVDLREGDVVFLLPPGETLGSRDRHAPLRRLTDDSADGDRHG